MNLKKSFAMALVSVAFAMAQDAAPAAQPAATAQPAAEQKPAAESAPVAEQPAAAPAAKEEAKAAPAEAPAATPAEAPAAEVAQPAPEPAPVKAEAAPAEVAAVPPQGPEGAPGEAPARMGPPKTPFTVLHGNAYNRVENEAAGDNVNILLSKRLTKLAGQKFFYIEPSGEMGAVSLGSFFAAMDISGDLGRATAGYATPSFAFEARVGLGQIKTDTKNVNQCKS